jgi:hypothetical protein
MEENILDNYFISARKCILDDPSERDYYHDLCPPSHDNVVGIKVPHVYISSEHIYIIFFIYIYNILLLFLYYIYIYIYYIYIYAHYYVYTVHPY